MFLGMGFLAWRLLSMDEEENIKKELIKEYKEQCLVLALGGSFFLLYGFGIFCFTYKGIEALVSEFNEAIQLLYILCIGGIIFSVFLFTLKVDINYYEKRFVKPPQDLNKAKTKNKISSVILFLLCSSYLVYWALRSDWLRIFLNK